MMSKHSPRYGNFHSAAPHRNRGTEQSGTQTSTTATRRAGYTANVSINSRRCTLDLWWPVYTSSSSSHEGVEIYGISSILLRTAVRTRRSGLLRRRCIGSHSILLVESLHPPWFVALDSSFVFAASAAHGVGVASHSMGVHVHVTRT